MNFKLCAGLSLVFIAACPKPDSSLERELEQRLERAAQQGFSGAALIRVNGRELLAKGYGLADRSERRPNTVDTAFDVGSILKLFTAIAVFQLDEAGALRVDDRLGSLLPGVPPDKAAITLREILLHRAGFGEYHDTEGDFEPMTREEARARIFAEPLRFEPGSDEAYSNSGYTLLADVIEAVSGEAYPTYLRRMVFEPAGMRDTGFYSEPLWQRVPTAIGYEAERFGDNDPASWPYTWALMGNGGLVTTVLDLDRFAEALWNGRILREAALETLERDYLSSAAVTLDGAEAFGSAGAGDFGLGGVSIDVPSRQTRIIFATNTYDAFDLESFAEDLVGWLLTRHE
jgi:CubicO group peptidase (beta-lactamase class C family)